MLQEHLRCGRGDKAWHEIAVRLESEGVEAVRREIRNVVCTKYWWTSGEFFICEGLLGWGPGHREWAADDLLPPPSDNCFVGLRRFLYALSQIPESPAIDQLLNARWDVANVSLAARTIRFLYRRTYVEEEIVTYLYRRIAEVKTPYELGAARPYFKMWMDADELAPVAISGLTMILCTRLDPCKVRRELVLQRTKLFVPQSSFAVSAAPATLVAA